MDPFQEQFSVMLPDGSIANDGAFTTVPAGKSRHISVYVTGAGAANALDFCSSVISGTAYSRIPIITQVGPKAL
jgi:hypothetical protein